MLSKESETRLRSAVSLLLGIEEVEADIDKAYDLLNAVLQRQYHDKKLEVK